MNIFSERLKIALSEKNMKASELSELTGISKSSISDWINGRYEAKQDKIFLIAKALKINESYLLGLDVPMTEAKNISNANVFIEETVKVLNLLPVSQQEQLLKLTKYDLNDEILSTVELMAKADDKFRDKVASYAKFEYFEYEKKFEQKNKGKQNSAS